MLGPLDDKLATLVIAQLLDLQSQDPKAPIEVIINSPGGQVNSALAITDTFADIRPRVDTVCVGSAHGVAALILACGARGHRRALTTAKIAVGDLRSTDRAPPADLEHVTQVYSDRVRAATGWTLAELHAAGGVFDAQQARAIGLIDSIVRR